MVFIVDVRLLKELRDFGELIVVYTLLEVVVTTTGPDVASGGHEVAV